MINPLTIDRPDSAMTKLKPTTVSKKTRVAPRAKTTGRMIDTDSASANAGMMGSSRDRRR
jgi:hypothetical protein